MDLFEFFLWLFWILFLCYIGYVILKTIRGFPSNKTYDKKGQDLIPHHENCKACGKMVINPIVCEYCHQKFCEKHQHPFIHKCKESQDQVPLFENCFFDGKRTYLPYKCHYCKKFFCGNHRHPFNHNCEKIEDYNNSPNIPGITIESRNGKIFVRK